MERSPGREGREGERLPQSSVSCCDPGACCGREGTAGGAESTALLSRLWSLFLNVSLRAPAFPSPVDVPFPSGTKLASYPSVAAGAAWQGGHPGYSDLGNEPNPWGRPAASPCPELTSVCCTWDLAKRHAESA